MDVKVAGKKGGVTTRDKYGKNYFKELSKKGVEARQKKRADNKG